MAEAAVVEVPQDNDEITSILSGDTEQETDKIDETEETEETEKEEVEKDESTEKGTAEGDGEKTGEVEEETVEEETEPTAKEVADSEIQGLQEENTKLRSYMRGMKQDLAVLKARSGRDAIETEEGEDPPEPTRVEVLAYELENNLNTNARTFNMQADQMRVTDEFSDIDNVCSERHWDDIVDAASEGIAKQQGVDVAEARLETENFIWGQTNPYKYMYDTIREYHPDFQGAEITTETKTGGKGTKVTEKEVKSAPSSVASVSSSSTAKSGWTADKIDKLDEMELSKVPADVYEKYMNDELD